MKGRYDTALATYQTMTPMLVMSTPARAGPRMRERLNWVELSASPEAIYLCSKIDGTIDWNDGIDRASVMPMTSDNAITIQGCSACVRSSTTTGVGHNIWID